PSPFRRGTKVPMTILVVDDQADQRLLIQQLLAGGGWPQVLLAESADEAFKALGVGSPSPNSAGVDVILMDINMPGLTGIQACERLKATAGLEDLPIVMVTAETDREHLKAAFTAGAVDYITKPLNKIELHARVRSVLTLKEEMDRRKANERALREVNRQLGAAMTALDEKHRLLQAEQEKSEGLLLSILPKPIAEQLKRDQGIIADSFSEVTVLFADIAEFTKLWVSQSPQDLVALLNEVFSKFDRLAEQHGLEKIKTIGDAYMAVGGLPTPRPNHAQSVADMALDMQAELDSCTDLYGVSLKLHIGVSTGPVVAGVIGRNKFIYDLWGDTVNTASRMEGLAQPGQILVTEDTYRHLRGHYRLEQQAPVHVKGKGEMVTYVLVGRHTPVLH
ncbi:MAG: adenylate/guanylate cyclase domain-containing protein, partial [Nitrospirales bacterium]